MMLQASNNPPNLLVDQLLYRQEQAESAFLRQDAGTQQVFIAARVPVCSLLCSIAESPVVTGSKHSRNTNHTKNKEFFRGMGLHAQTDLPKLTGTTLPTPYQRWAKSYGVTCCCRLASR